MHRKNLLLSQMHRNLAFGRPWYRFLQFLADEPWVTAESGWQLKVLPGCQICTYLVDALHFGNSTAAGCCSPGTPSVSETPSSSACLCHLFYKHQLLVTSKIVVTQNNMDLFSGIRKARTRSQHILWPSVLPSCTPALLCHWTLSCTSYSHHCKACIVHRWRRMRS